MGSCHRSGRLLVVISWIASVSAILAPSDFISVDCGGQQTFTCVVNGLSAVWNITGLDGIAAFAHNGQYVASNNNRVTTSDKSSLVNNSTITITGLTTADDGGIVQCVNFQDGSVQGSATISVESTTLTSATSITANVDLCSANLTWSEPSDSNVTISVSCTPLSTHCSSCTSSGCTIEGLSPSTLYTFPVTRITTGCDNSTATSSAVMSGSPPSCASNVNVVSLNSDICTIMVTWSSPANSGVTSTQVTYCPEANPNCNRMIQCPPFGSCSISGLSRDTSYLVSVTPMNACGGMDCMSSAQVVRTNAGCRQLGSQVTPEPTNTAILASVIPAVAIPAVALILTSIITVVVVVLLARHCYRKSLNLVSSKQEDVYDQPVIHGIYEDIDICMTPNPVYEQTSPTNNTDNSDNYI